MWDRFRPAALTAALLAATSLIAHGQPQSGPGVVTDPGTGTTVFRGAPSATGGAAEIPGYGSGPPSGGTTSASGTTIFHGTPGGTAGPSPPTSVPPAPTRGGER